MTCPHCGSDNVAPRTSFRPRCEQTGYDDGGEFMECVTCGTKGDLVDFADDEDLEKLYFAIMNDRDDPRPVPGSPEMRCRHFAPRRNQ